MKRIFVDIYLAYNLGDDLFLDILSKKYPETEFTVNYVGNDYDRFIKKYGNVKRRKYTLYDKVLQRFKIKDILTNYKELAKNHDAMIFIGGSIFRDESYHESLYKDRMNMVDEFRTLNKPVFILGSNFGPYTRTSFLEDYKKLYAKCEDVCFRDTYSYNLFKDMNNVRCKPDIVFQLDLDRFKNNDKKNIIGFSIIDVNHKNGLRKYEKEYIDCTIKSIKLLVSKGYRCCLMSFCEKEGDLKCINNIINMLDNEIMKNVDLYEYRGDLEESFELISKFKLFIAARFHANIIAQLLNVPVLPVIYSNKTLNMLKDINLDSIMVSMDNLNMLYNEEILEKSFTNIANLTDIKNDAKLQFKKLSLFIEE